MDNPTFDAFQKDYEKLLHDPYFQNAYGSYLNLILQKQPKAYEGLKRKVIFQKNNIKLYHYSPLSLRGRRGLFRGGRGNPPALLIIYAFVNRPTILDLQENRSFIKKLLDNNLDVYLLDWGDPLPEDKNNSLYDYLEIINKLIPKKTNLLGVCQGGTLSLCYAALYPKKINKLITMVTPINFQNSLLTGLLQNIDTSLFQENIPGKFLSMGLQSLKPFRFLKIAEIELDFFLNMEKWMNDCPDHPGKAFHEFIHQFYQKNNLARVQLYLNKKHIDLSKITCPILNIYAEQDHLVPPHASDILKDLVGSLDYQEIKFNSGHIGVFVSEKALNILPQKIAEFLMQ